MLMGYQLVAVPQQLQEKQQHFVEMSPAFHRKHSVEPGRLFKRTLSYMGLCWLKESSGPEAKHLGKMYLYKLALCEELKTEAAYWLQHSL